MNGPALKFWLKSAGICSILLLTMFRLGHTGTPGATAASPAEDGKQAYELSERERKALRLEAGPERTLFIQLFTSNAEPSCNAALKWMSSLKQGNPGLWKIFVPVAMHVRQWDSGGYHDAFAKNEFDEFLKNLARQWGSGRTYTPTVAVNGTEWSGWSRGQDILPDSRRAGFLKTDGTRLPDTFDIFFEPDLTINRGAGFEAHGALLAFELQSRPSDGKNKGSVLIHDFICLAHVAAPMRSETKGWKVSLNLAKPKTIRIQKCAVAFWITEPGSPIALQATGGFLPD